MPLQQRTLLIVDDSPEDRELYRRYLLRDRDYAYTFLEATLGRQGLELWQQHQPDAVLLDYRLPDLDGLEFLAQLCPLGQSPCLPVIVVTGQGNEAIAVQAMKAGAQDYIVKEQITPTGLQLAVSGTIETVQLRAQLQLRIEREKVVAQITRQIHQSLELDEILQTTVEEVRHFLHSDRVLVFRLEQPGTGIVVAESLAAGCRSLLSCLPDSCLGQQRLLTYSPPLAETYIDRYQQGQVTAIADIEDGNFDPALVELLAQFQVKANLVVPILQNNRLWGMLVAHHCTAPRPWQPMEIDLLQELATQVAIALQQAELYQQAQTELVERRRAETELQQSEQRYAALAEISPVGIFRTTIDGDCLYTNPRWCELAGITPEAAQGKGWCNALHPDDSDRVSAEWYRAAAVNAPFLSEYRFQTPEGVVSWLVGQAIAEKDSAGNVIGYVGTVTDISYRKQAEQVLSQSEERYRTLFESMNEGFCVIEMLFDADNTPCDYRFLEINPVFEAQTGLQQATGKTARQMISDLESHWFEIYGNVALTGEPARFENGSEAMNRWFEVSAFRIGQPEHHRVAILFKDISDRRRAELALRQSEERYRYLIETIPQLVWTCDTNGLCDYVNQQLCDYTGLTFEQALGEGWLSAVHPDDRQGSYTVWMNAVQNSTAYRHHYRFREAASNHYRWHLVLGLPLKDQDGQVVKWFGSCTDIHDQKELATERDRIIHREKAARLQSERANQIKDEFLAVLSHELRSPLNPILGWTKLLQTYPFDQAKTAEALAIIERNAKLQTQLIDDLLDIAKILRGKLSINAVPVNLAVAAESAIDTVKTAAIAKSILIHPVLPNVGQVLGDSTRLQQIVWNLLSNAIKFTPQGGRVNIQLEQVGDRARLVVSDTGKGIDPNFLPHIFESFQQEDYSITRKYGGLGLGLAIVRQLVEALGGTIAAASPGANLGATFTVLLPLLRNEPEPQKPEQISKIAYDLTGIRVLTVDDDPDARELLTFLLTQHQAEVLSLTSAAEALANLDSFQPDVLISDIGMPEVDGYTLIQQIRTLPAEKGGQVPAIALTAYAREDDQQRALASGYQRHITKPLEIDQLVQAVLDLSR